MSELSCKTHKIKAVTYCLTSGPLCPQCLKNTDHYLHQHIPMGNMVKVMSNDNLAMLYIAIQMPFLKKSIDTYLNYVEASLMKSGRLIAKELHVGSPHSLLHRKALSHLFANTTFQSFGKCIDRLTKGIDSIVKHFISKLNSKCSNPYTLKDPLNKSVMPSTLTVAPIKISKPTQSQEISGVPSQPVHYIYEDILVLFDKTSKKKSCCPLHKKFSSKTESISYNNKVLIIDIQPNMVEEYDLLYHSLISRSPSPIVKYWFTLHYANDIVYSIGGNNVNNDPLVDCHSFCTTKNSWAKMPNLSISRYSCAAFDCEKYLYVCGGQLNTECNLFHMERILIGNGFEGKKWEDVMVDGNPAVFSDAHAVVVKDSIMILSIYGVYKFELVNDRWAIKEMGSMNKKAQFYNCSAAVYDGLKVYAVDCDKIINIYDPATHQWETY